MDESRKFIKLEHFLVRQRLVWPSRRAEQTIHAGAVRVNGEVETGRMCRLYDGFTVTVGGKTIRVNLNQTRKSSMRLDRYLELQGIPNAGQLIRGGAVRLAGRVEAWRKRKVFDGDTIIAAGKTFIVKIDDVTGDEPDKRP